MSVLLPSILRGSDSGGGPAIPDPSALESVLPAPSGTVLVYGLGLSGVAVSRLLLSRGVRVLAADDRESLEVPEDLDGSDAFELWRDGLDDLEGVEAVVISPGVPPHRPLLRRARAASIPVLGEVEVAWRLLVAHRPDVARNLVAVTGSNGKSTTTKLAEALLGEERAVACGNIGLPFSRSVAELLDGDPDDAPVLCVELSSFQLDTVETFRPKAAALLNLSADHVDHHGSEEAYYAAKRRIFSAQRAGDVAVLGRDQEDVAATDVPEGVRRRWFSLRSEVDDGCWLHDHEIRLREPGGEPYVVFRRSDLPLVGDHNLANAMAALLLAEAAGADVSRAPERLSRFTGLPHRSQVVAEAGGVRWIDDSKGTNVGATAKSLEGFAEGSVHLIAGGRSKGARFTGLRELVASRVARLYVVGEAADRLAEDLGDVVPVERSGTLDAAVSSAQRHARSGDVVLLSPACASFDQFDDYAERGRFFQREIDRVLRAAGQRGAEASRPSSSEVGDG